MTAPPHDVGRSDARRNRTKVLAAASRAFDEHGLDVSLGTIARQAGVGVGTVYRHFPSKEILLEAVLVQQIDDQVDSARRWAARTDPVAAFFGFLLEVVDTSHGRKHVCDALTTETSWPRPGLAASARRFRQALDELLRAAQRAGGVRADVSADDVARAHRRVRDDMGRTPRPERRLPHGAPGAGEPAEFRIRHGRAGVS